MIGRAAADKYWPGLLSACCGRALPECGRELLKSVQLTPWSGRQQSTRGVPGSR